MKSKAVSFKAHPHLWKRTSENLRALKQRWRMAILWCHTFGRKKRKVRLCLAKYLDETQCPFSFQLRNSYNLTPCVYYERKSLASEWTKESRIEAPSLSLNAILTARRSRLSKRIEQPWVRLVTGRCWTVVSFCGAGAVATNYVAQIPNTGVVALYLWWWWGHGWASFH